MCCIKIRTLYRTSLMFLWELKNAIISQNLRELCDIKTNIKSTHSGFDKLSRLLFHYTVPEPVEGTFLFLPVISTPLNHRIIYYYSRCLSLLKAHYFYCIKIRALLRTSLMFLWELKNGIISQNLRELCVIKANTNIPHIVASTSSATNSFITRCLSLSKAHSQFSSRCLSVVEGTLFLLH